MQWEQFPNLLASTGGDVVHLWKAAYVRASPAETLWDLPCSLGVQQRTKKLWRCPWTGYAHSLSVTLQFPFRALGLSTLYLTSLGSFLSLYFSLRRFHNTKYSCPIALLPSLSFLTHFLARSLKPPGLFMSFHLFSIFFTSPSFQLAASIHRAALLHFISLPWLLFLLLFTVNYFGNCLANVLASHVLITEIKLEWEEHKHLSHKPISSSTPHHQFLSLFVYC